MITERLGYTKIVRDIKHCFIMEPKIMEMNPLLEDREKTWSQDLDFSTVRPVSYFEYIEL